MVSCLHRSKKAKNNESLQKINPFPAIHNNCHLLSLLLMYFEAYIANNMDQDQTAPLGLILFASKVKRLRVGASSVSLHCGP